jgi:UDP-N-acetylglucosamine 2-epimerase (non-hydrolysing)
MAPFPEEYHRRVIAVGTALHCAPTNSARDNLLRENIPSEKIVVSGNTVIDALLETAALGLNPPQDFPEGRVILMTAHRRENFGAPLREAFAGIRAFLDVHTSVYFPVHPNPKAADVANEILSGHPRVRLVQPLSYRNMVAALQHCWCVITDSGGLQEEAPALGKPVLVMRDVTERPEAVVAGVVDGLYCLHRDPEKYQRMARPVFPYGDGKAGKRIADAIHANFAGATAAPCEVDLSDVQLGERP